MYKRQLKNWIKLQHEYPCLFFVADWHAPVSYTHLDVYKRQSLDNVAVFSRYAREFGFLASCGSDFHGPGESYIDLGKIAPLPTDLTPVWDAF